MGFASIPISYYAFGESDGQQQAVRGGQCCSRDQIDPALRTVRDALTISRDYGFARTLAAFAIEGAICLQPDGPFLRHVAFVLWLQL